MKKNNHLKLAKEWLWKGQNDLKTAEILFREKGPADSLCFHCQQAVEKYLKAYLVFKRLHFEKIHNLWSLAKLCAQKDKSFLDFEKDLKTLDAYYIEFRYPPETRVYSRKECKETLGLSIKLTQFIVDKIL